MRRGKATTSLAAFALALAFAVSAPAHAAPRAPSTRALLAELVAVDTSLDHGTTLAAQKMAKRLRDGGVPAADVVLVGPSPTKMNLVARLRSAAPKRRPLL